MGYLQYALLAAGFACLWLVVARPGSLLPGGLRPTLPRAAVPAFVGLAAASLLYFSLRQYPSVGGAGWLADFDARYWYLGGRVFRSGGSPYDPVLFRRAWVDVFGEGTIPGYGVAFVYPPALMILAVPMSLLPWPAASAAVKVVSLGCLAGILRLSAGLVRRARRDDAWPREAWVLAGLGALLLSVTQTIFQGQTSLLVVLGVLLAVHGWVKGSLPILAVGAILGSMKPQISLLVLVFVLVSAGVLRAAISAAAVAAVWAAGIRPPLGSLLDDLSRSLTIHKAQVWNRLDHYDSVAGLLGATPLGPVLLYGSILVGIAAAVCLGLRSRGDDDPATRVRRLAWLSAASVALLPMHRYDATIYLPVLLAAGLLPRLGHKLLLTGAIVLHGYVWDYRISTAMVLPLVGFDRHRALELDRLGSAGHAAAVMGVVILALTLSLPGLRPGFTRTTGGTG